MYFSKIFKKKTLLYFIVFISVLLLDQCTKRIMLHEVGLNNTRTFFPGLMQITVVQNTGGAFSIFRQFPVYFQIVGVINVIIFSYLAFCPTVSFNNLIKTGCSCILGGTVGNLIDRFVNSGVIDFIDLQLFHFAVFNLADVFIDVGVVMILTGWYISRKKHQTNDA